jgi:hypothetical protein
MYARWVSFGIGLAVMLAPLAVGYHAPGPILQDVGIGLLACIATLAALEWPAFRFALALPASWLLLSGRGADRLAVAVIEISSGTALLLLAGVPSARRLSRAAQARDAARA